MAGQREPSMEDILASIKRVIAEEKEIRAAPVPVSVPVSAVTDSDVADDPDGGDERHDGDILLLEASMPGNDDVEPFAALQMDPLPPFAPAPAPLEPSPLEPSPLEPSLVEPDIAQRSRSSLEALASLAASPPPSTANPLEEMVRDLLRPILKQWLDEHLPKIVDEHVRREVSRITGRPL